MIMGEEKLALYTTNKEKLLVLSLEQPNSNGEVPMSQSAKAGNINISRDLQRHDPEFNSARKSPVGWIYYEDYDEVEMQQDDRR